MSLRKPQVNGKKSPNKLVMAFAVMAATTVVGAAGVANAATPEKVANTPMPPSKEACKKDGWKQFGFKNQGLCVKWFNQHGNGYGGGGNNNNVGNKTDINLEVNGDRNVITIIVHNITNIFN